MAVKINYSIIPLDDLVIGSKQVRLSNIGAEIDELAQNIKVNGLLQPIIVAPKDKKGKYEIILGQRRFLAHRLLKEKSIMAGILTEKLSEIEAKILYLSENKMRRDLDTSDLNDVCNHLFNELGSTKEVHEKSGIPESIIRQYVKYPRLDDELKKMVDNKDIGIKDAIDAQEAVWDQAKDANKKRVDLANKFKKMAGQKKKRAIKIVKTNPKISIDNAIKLAAEQTIHTIKISMGDHAHAALKRYADVNGQNLSETAADLIDESLSSLGFLNIDED